MADASKSKQNNKYYFVTEEGEISDIEEEDVNEKEDKRKRDDDLIKEWSECVRPQHSSYKGNDGEMDISSDIEQEEDNDNKIDVKPVAITITFHNGVFASKYRQSLLRELTKKFGSQYVDSNNDCIFVLHESISTEITATLKNPLNAISFVFHDEAFCDENSDYIKKLCADLFGASKILIHQKWLIEVVQEDFLDFSVDTEPYKNKTILYEKSKEIAPKESINKRRNGKIESCFNCLGQHSLRNCNRPRNHKMIEKHRKRFLSSKNSRYHAEVDKFSGFSPGEIGEELRNALGLKAEQLPRHIYNMRKYGYPPGWLLEAKVPYSGVNIYGKTGIVPEAGDEEGEVFDEGEKDLYDIRKLVAFPGFNAPPPENMIDESESLNCLPFSEEHSLENLISKLQPNALKAYKKRCLPIQIGDQVESGSDGEKEKLPLANLETPPCSAADSLSTSQSSCSSATRPTTPQPSALPKTISVDLGTPLLKSHSPFGKIPDRKKFCVDISDVINFENLPDSTGTYGKMVTSITKIREYNAKNNY